MKHSMILVFDEISSSDNVFCSGGFETVHLHPSAAGTVK